MRASFWLKMLAGLAVVAVLGAGGALFAIRRYLPEPELRAKVLAQARKQLGREVKLEKLEVGLGGVTLHALEVSEAPDFSAGSFVKVERFHLRPSWRALLKRELVVASVSLDGPRVRVVKGKDGRFNYETLMSTAAKPAAPAAPEAAAEETALDVRRARIAGGSIEYVDLRQNASWKVSELELTAKDFSQLEPFDLDAELRVQGKAGDRPVDARIVFRGSPNLAGGSKERFAAKIKELRVEQDGLALALSGKVARLDAPDAGFELKLSAAGKTLLEAEGTAKLGEVKEVDLKASSPGLDTTLIAKYLPQSGIPALKLPALKLALQGKAGADEGSLRAFSLSWDGGKVQGSGSAKGLKGASPVYEGKASIAADIPKIEPGQYPFLKLPAKLGVPAMRVDGEVSLTGAGELSIPGLKIKLDAGTLTATGAVKKAMSAKPLPDVSIALALDVPSFKVSELPVELSTAVPRGLSVPAFRVDGTIKAKGEDVALENVAVKAKDGWIKLNGSVAKALAGAPQPDVSLAAELNLPPLTDKELPFPGVPEGLKTPASRWEAELDYSPRAVRVRKLRLQTGKNDVAVEGSIGDPAGRAAYDLLVKCRSFVLEELTQLTPQTRELKLAGAGFFALSVTGHKEKPVLAGKLQFKGLGATVAGLPLSEFTGTLSFDERRADLPNLTGKLADGTLKADITLKDFLRAPDLEVEASLDRFDLGRFLAAKTRMAAEKDAAKAAPGAKPSAETKPAPLRTKGKFEIGALAHPTATVEQVKLSWDLHELTPDQRSMDGEARLTVGKGKILELGAMATQSKIVKVAILPILVIQKIGRIGGIRLFPDFNNIEVYQVVGDYGFKDGLMTLRRSEMHSSAAHIGAKGTIDLPKEALDLMVTAQVASIAPMDVGVTGSFDKPKTDLKLGKFLAEQPKNLIQGLLKQAQ